MNTSIMEKDVSLFLNVSMPTVYNVMKSADFPSFQVAGRILVRREKFFSWLEGHEQKGCDNKYPNSLCALGG